MGDGEVRRLRLLLDTNILIPLEPASAAAVVPNTDSANSLFRLATQAGHALFRHQLSRCDIAHDTDKARADDLKLRLQKYPELPDPPPITASLRTLLGESKPGSNDWVDDHLVAALHADAIDLLVSEDRGVRAKARRLGIGERVLTLSETLSALGVPSVVVPPAVRSVLAHALRADDPIFDSFRVDYSDFDQWLASCKREHRKAWKIDGADALAAFCIVKDEGDEGFQIGTRALKLCSFKVAQDYNGFRYGELLLKAVFDHAHRHNRTGIYVTIFEKHSQLIELLDDFGFARLEQTTSRGELVLAKSLVPRSGEAYARLEYHIRFGPPRFDPHTAWYLVPILPDYSDVLFPETSTARQLVEGQHPFGNAIRKAYLCNSPCRQIVTGDILAFYRTHKRRGLIALGVVEGTLVSDDLTSITRAVARRTVYSTKEIEELCRRDVLALMFRQAVLVDPCKTPDELTGAGVFHRVPQSIMRIGTEGTKWLISQFAV